MALVPVVARTTTPALRGVLLMRGLVVVTMEVITAFGNAQSVVALVGTATALYRVPSLVAGGIVLKFRPHKS